MAFEKIVRFHKNLNPQNGVVKRPLQFLEFLLRDKNRVKNSVHYLEYFTIIRKYRVMSRGKRKIFQKK